MKNKKYILFISTFLFIFLLSLLVVYAHPGKTDANGGHWNHKTGEYHFHTGEYAGKNRSSGSTKKEYEYDDFEPPYDPPTENPYRKNKNNDTTTDYSNNNKEYKNTTSYKILIVIVYIFSFLFVLSCALGVFYGIFYFIYSLTPNYKINALCNSLLEFNNIQEQLTKLSIDMSYYKKNSQIPTIYEIGIDNLPKEKNVKFNWGDSFTFFKTRNGAKLHNKYKCCKATIPYHIYKYLDSRNEPVVNSDKYEYYLCKKCSNYYKLPDMTWYVNYLNYTKAKEERQKIANKNAKLCFKIKKLHKKCNSNMSKIIIMHSKKNKIKLIEANEKYKEMQKVIKC